MKTEIKKAADGVGWNLYVNGNLAVAYDTHTVCSKVKEALNKPYRGPHDCGQSLGWYYSEAAEIYSVIKKTLEKV